MTESDELPAEYTIDPSGLGEYVNHGLCPRYGKLRTDGDLRDELADEREYREAFTPLSPLLAEEGNEYEEDVYTVFEDEAYEVLDSWREYEHQEENNNYIRDAVAATALRDPEDGPTILKQARFGSQIGAFNVFGDSDLVAIWPTDRDHVVARVFDIKASHEEKTYHQIQTACYSALLEEVLDTADRDDLSYTIETGIIHRQTDLESISPDALPSFDRRPREADVARLLQWDGELHRMVRRDVDDVPHQLDTKCQTCTYNEFCYTQSVESADIRLLGLTRGEQEAFRSHGIETVEQVAKFINPVEKPRPYQYDEPEIRDEYSDIEKSLAEEHGVGERLAWLAQKAQALLKKLDPDNPYAFDGFGTPYIIGSGDGSLPEDDPHPKMGEPSIQRGSLVRVYLNIQWDYLRDRVAMVSGHVDCDNYDGTGLSFSHAVEEIPDDEETDSSREESLLNRSFTDLFSAVEIVSQLSDQPTRAPVHLYFYTQQERDALMDAVKRHPSLSEASAVRDLLGLRAGIDQPMVSVVQEEVERRLAPLQPSTGLLPMMDSLKPYDDSESFQYDQWSYVREDGTDVDLRQAFRVGMFDYSTPFSRDDEETGITLHLGGSGDEDDWYPSRARFGADVPLEYIWGTEDVDELTPEMADNPQQKGRIDIYRYVNPKLKSTRLTNEDVERLGECLAKGVKHVERAIQYKNSDIEKNALEVQSLDTFTLGDASLADACREYLDLEYASNESDLLASLQKPLKQRVLAGDSIPIRVTEVVDQDGGKVVVDGELMYDDIGFASPQAVANACSKSGSDENSGGDWMVATPIENRGNTYVEDVSNPQQMLKSCKATLERFDPETGNVRISSLNWNGSGEYNVWHRGWTLNEADANENHQKTYLGPGAELVLDEQVDDLTASRAREALQFSESNEVYNLFKDLSDGTADLHTDAFTQSHVDEFAEWLQENNDPSPNDEQDEFIRKSDTRASLLQGPPGTGKTAGATSLAILARLYAAEKDGRAASTLVTGASNKSIVEVMEDVSDALETYRETAEDGALDNVRLVRLCNSEPSRPLRNVDYADYHNPEHAHIFQQLEDRLSPASSRQSTLGETGGEPHVVLFATPTKLHGYLNRFDPLNQNWGVEDVYERGLNLFDVVAADEASMLPIPQVLMGGAFLKPDGQLLVTGDQRQMPPVHRHDWSLEDRRTVEQVAPYVSTLNYLRFLRGEDVDSIPDEVESPEVEIPFHQLQETYRCHEVVAEFLRRWVYSKDNIEYTSNQTDVIPSPEVAEGEGMEAALEPDAPLTLVLHDDETSRQSNIVEAQIATRVLESIPPSETTGVVTPHNAQKGLISTMTERTDAVDTVERFQGGQRDVMVVSSTVSDPDYLDAESDFILSLARLNVALSRMKKKLVVVAPKSLFRVLPMDVDEYEDSIIWKGLYHECGADGDPTWNGTLGSLLSDDEAIRAETNVSVFQKTAEE